MSLQDNFAVDVIHSSISKLHLGTELRLAFKLALPSTVFQILQFCIWAMNIPFLVNIPHDREYLRALVEESTATPSGLNSNRPPIETLELTGVSMGTLIANITGLTVVFGIMSAFETLGPQAFGAKQFRRVGDLLLRSMLLCGLAIPPIIFFWFHMDVLLSSLGIDPVTSYLAARFLRTYGIGFPALIAFECARRFFSCQEVIADFVGMQAIITVFHGVGLYVFIGPVGLGFDGVGAAMIATFWFALALLALWVHIFRRYHPQTAPVLTREAFRSVLKPSEIWVYVKLAFGGLLGLSEWWFWEATAFLAAAISPTVLAAHTIAYTVAPLAFMLPLGISIWLAIRIGQILGAGEGALARRFAVVTVVAGMVVCSISAIIVYSLRDVIISIYTADQAVIKEAHVMWPFLAFLCFSDALFGLQRGVMIGAGLQLAMGITMLLSVWLIGFTSQVVSTVVFHQGIFGVWWPFIPAYIVLNVLLFLGHQLRDWEKLAATAMERAGCDGVLGSGDTCNEDAGAIEAGEGDLVPLFRSSGVHIGSESESSGEIVPMQASASSSVVSLCSDTAGTPLCANASLQSGSAPTPILRPIPSRSEASLASMSSLLQRASPSP